MSVRPGETRLYSGEKCLLRTYVVPLASPVQWSNLRHVRSALHYNSVSCERQGSTHAEHEAQRSEVSNAALMDMNAIM